MKSLREPILYSLAALVLAAAACGKKSSAPSAEVTGLAAVPASAVVVITADVARVVDSPLVARAVDQLLARDADLAARWQKLKDSCKLDFATQIKHVVLAVGPSTNGADTLHGAGPPGPQPGTGPVLMIATGKLVENEFAACVRSMVGKGGGDLTAKPLGSRTLYQAKEGNRGMFFAFGRADTVVLGSDEAYVAEALGPGKKLSDNPEMSQWLALADQHAPLWAVGRADERVRQGLVKATAGQISAGPVAFTVSADTSNGAKFEVDAVMATAADAKALESFAKQNLALAGMAAQGKSLGKIVDHIAIAADGAVLRLKANLDIADVNLLVSALDGGGPAAQDSPPAPVQGSGSGQ
ncbi:MAG: hypothetical protein JWO36_3526 [Myxococcales bacterium]|nr:hypothetical protein [Myxococcales bacterium]